jgi:hypothetical protein
MPTITPSSTLLSISNTVTLTGTPAFSLAFLYGAVSSYSHLVGTTFSGSATGQRFYLYANAVYSDGSAHAPTFLPGNAVGTTLSGAVYNNDESLYGWTNYTPTVSTSGGTTFSVSGKYKARGYDLQIVITAACTNGGAGTSAGFSLPTAHDQDANSPLGTAVAAQALVCLNRTGLVSALGFIDSGGSSIGISPAGFAFTTGHTYLISGMIALG